MQEKELIQELKSQNGKNQAFNTLVKKYQEKLYWHIRRIVIKHDDCDDVLQNTFIKVWNNIENFRAESSLYTWLFRIATNESLTFLAQQKRRRIVFHGEENEFLSENLESDEYFDGNEIQLKLQKAILKLPEKQRIVFNMKYFDDIKYCEMAQILDTSEGALKASYHHAVKKIEDYLKNDS